MALKQTVKELQVQHTQFQETLLNLAQGQKDLMALVAKKKKTKKPVVILNMARRFKGHIQPIQVDDVFSEEDDNQEEDGRSIKHEGRHNQGYENVHEDEYYSNEHYPPADEKYKQLEDRLKAMEIYKVSGLDFGELGLVQGVVIPHKCKVLVFSKYDGFSCPKLHLRLYVRKIQPHTVDRKLWVHFFQESLSDNQLEWFY